MRRSLHRRGLSLLELVLAVFLVLTAVTYLASLFVFGSAPQLRAQEMTRTTMLMCSQVDAIIAEPVADVQPAHVSGRRFDPPFEMYSYDLDITTSQVVDRDGFDRKVVSYKVTVTPPKGNPETVTGYRVSEADRGAKLYDTYQCGSCHMLSGTRSATSTTYAPTLNGIGATAGSRVPGLSAKAYIRQSIRNPDAFIAPGYSAPSGMGSGYDRQEMPQADLDALTLFLLKK